MDERDDERRAIVAFASFLRNRFSGSVVWRRGDDPPDYVLKVDDATFAVEVTTVTESYSREGREKLSDIGLGEMVSRFATSVESHANHRQPLDSLYSFHLYGPLGAFESNRRDLEVEVLHFIDSNRTAGDIDMHEIGSVGDFELWMGKGHGRLPGLSWGYESQASWVTNGLVVEFNTLVKKAVEDKRRKLSRIRLPKILLLIDLYWWLDAELFPQCPICSNPDPEFHSAYVLTSDYKIHELWCFETTAQPECLN